MIFSALMLVLLAACGTDSEDTGGAANGSLKVVTSFTIIDDLAKEIGGENVEVHNLVPTGTDPHEYEPLPEDTKLVAVADVLFYNGFDFGGGENGWFFKMVDSVGQDEENVFSLTEDVEPMHIGEEDGVEEEINPHAGIDQGVGMKMAEAIRDALIEVDPEHEKEYQKRANEYLNRLEEIAQEYEEKISDIPKEDRVLVTSERAFQYLADRYGLKEGFIWEIDTEENGSPDQIKSLVEFIDKNEVPTLFVESNVDTRPMETVSNESGVPIFEEPIYSDEIGEPGEEVDTYIKYLEYNIDVIYNGLTQD